MCVRVTGYATTSQSVSQCPPASLTTRSVVRCPPLSLSLDTRNPDAILASKRLAQVWTRQKWSWILEAACHEKMYKMKLWGDIIGKYWMSIGSSYTFLIFVKNSDVRLRRTAFRSWYFFWKLFILRETFPKKNEFKKRIITDGTKAKPIRYIKSSVLMAI